MADFDVLNGGLYALSKAEGGEQVVAWVRASPRQDWAPLGRFDTSELATDACREHYKQQQRKKAQKVANGTG